jgi:hypothetical protein
MKYRVYIDANARQMDTSQRTLHGEYDTPEQAVAAAREVVRTRLVEEHRAGMKAEELLQRFAQRGETAFIMPMDESTLLDLNEHARECAERLCWREELRD